MDNLTPNLEPDRLNRCVAIALGMMGKNETLVETTIAPLVEGNAVSIDEMFITFGIYAFILAEGPRKLPEAFLGRKYSREEVQALLEQGIAQAIKHFR